MANTVNLARVDFTDMNDKINFIVEEDYELKRFSITDIDVGGEISIDLEGENSGASNLINADTLSGYKANEFVKQNDIKNYLSINFGDVRESNEPILVDADMLGGIVANEYAKLSDLEKYAKLSDFENTDNGVTINTGISMELLWENVSPSSTFAGQTIAMDLSDYDAIMLFAYSRSGTTNNPENYEISQMCMKGETSIITVYRWLSIEIFGRLITVNQAGVNISEGKYASGSATSWIDATNRDIVIPIKIYGIKGVKV